MVFSFVCLLMYVLVFSTRSPSHTGWTDVGVSSRASHPLHHKMSALVNLHGFFGLSGEMPCKRIWKLWCASVQAYSWLTPSSMLMWLYAVHTLTHTCRPLSVCIHAFFCGGGWTYILVPSPGQRSPSTMLSQSGLFLTQVVTVPHAKNVFCYGTKIWQTCLDHSKPWQSTTYNWEDESG